jgi:hypothetical protein
MDIGIGDGSGGADFILKPNSPLRKECMPSKPGVNPDAYWCSPMVLRNTWITTQDDMKAFAAWAYDIPADTAQIRMNQIREDAQ